MSAPNEEEESVESLLTKAKDLVQQGELLTLRYGVEKMAAAHSLGATQRQIAEAVGRSPAWVCEKLQWRERGYVETTFGPGAKESRKRRARVQTPEREAIPGDNTGREQAQQSRARARQAEAEAARTEAEARKARAEAAKAEAEARKAKASAQARSFRSSNARPANASIPGGARSLLVKTLGMLGSDQAGERAAAALMAERQRAKLGMTWDDLIVEKRHEHNLDGDVDFSDDDDDDGDNYDDLDDDDDDDDDPIYGDQGTAS